VRLSLKILFNNTFIKCYVKYYVKISLLGRKDSISALLLGRLIALFCVAHFLRENKNSQWDGGRWREERKSKREPMRDFCRMTCAINREKYWTYVWHSRYLETISFFREQRWKTETKDPICGASGKRKAYGSRYIRASFFRDMRTHADLCC